MPLSYNGGILMAAYSNERNIIIIITNDRKIMVAFNNRLVFQKAKNSRHHMT